MLPFKVTHVIVRHVEGDESVPLMGYKDRERAEWALAELEDHLAKEPGGGDYRHPCPVGFALRVVVGRPPEYMRPTDQEGFVHPWLAEPASRREYPAAWEMHDLKKVAGHWWAQANPLDVEWTHGCRYTVEVIGVEVS